MVRFTARPRPAPTFSVGGGGRSGIRASCRDAGMAVSGLLVGWRWASEGDGDIQVGVAFSKEVEGEGGFVCVWGVRS